MVVRKGCGEVVTGSLGDSAGLVSEYILQNAAQTTYKEPSPVSSVASGPLCTTERDRPTGPTRLQTPHCGRRVDRAVSLQEAKLGTRPQRHFYQHQKETTANETAPPHRLRPLALYMTNGCRAPGALLCPGVYPVPRLSRGPKYLMNTYFTLGTVLSTVNSQITETQCPLSISLQSNGRIK